MTYFTYTVSKELGLCNGMMGRYHSLCISHEEQEFLKLQLPNLQPGSIVTLNDVPLTVNVTIDKPRGIGIDWKNTH